MTKNPKHAQVFHFDLQGKREAKYDFLNQNSLETIPWNELQPETPNFFLVKKDFDQSGIYEKGFKVDELFRVNGNGVQTKRDNLFVEFESKALTKRIQKLTNLSELTSTFIKEYSIVDSPSYNLLSRIKNFKFNELSITNFLYRPFDFRKIYYEIGLTTRPAWNVMQHLLNKSNFALLSLRQSRSGEYGNYFIGQNLINKDSISSLDSVNVFPLYLYPEESKDLFAKTERTPNLNAEIIKQIAKQIGLTFTPEKFPSLGGVPAGRGGFFEMYKDQGGSFEMGGSFETPEDQGGRNTQNYMSLPYNPKLKERAKELRQAGNLSEVLFWNQVKNKQFKDFDFDRQKIIGNYIVDFYCSNCNVVIEIDGSSHDDKQEYDAERDTFLSSLGLKVIHIPVFDVMKKMNGVMEMLFNHPAFQAPLQRRGINYPDLQEPPLQKRGINYPDLQEPPLQRREINHPAINDSPPQEGSFAPIDILDYIYAVLHSPSYREKYKEFLKIDFPRVPYPKDATTFWALVALGAELRQIHLLESPVVEKYITQYPLDGDNVVTKPRFINSPPLEGCLKGGVVGKVFINDTQYFGNVPEVAWNFYIGGYQPAQKWLKDRKDRTLEFDDILHYQKIIVALTETARLMEEINKINT